MAMVMVVISDEAEIDASQAYQHRSDGGGGKVSKRSAEAKLPSIPAGTWCHPGTNPVHL